jgi:hypothetical protein
MQTTYHISSAQDISIELLEAIKATFKTKPICITVEDEIDTTDYLNSSLANKEMLNKSIIQDQKGEYIVKKADDL